MSGASGCVSRAKHPKSGAQWTTTPTIYTFCSPQARLCNWPTFGKTHPFLPTATFFHVKTYNNKGSVFLFSYCIEGRWRRVNALEFFKKGIMPKWEDPLNAQGGRLVFSINSPLPNPDQIYSHIVFFLLGEDFEHSERINGFRFIASKSPQQTHFRVQIWVSFNKSNIEALHLFRSLLEHLFRTLNIDMVTPEFKNNATQPR